MHTTIDEHQPCQVHTECPYESYAKLDRARKKAKKMTFQIGLFGSDGMLLAGDTKSSEAGVPRVPRNSEDYRYSEMDWSTVTTKFMCKMKEDKTEDLSMVIAQCGDPISRKIADAMLYKWDRVEHRTAGLVLNDIYAEVYGFDTWERKQSADLLIVRQQEREMLRCTSVNGNAVTPIAHREGKVITGKSPSLALLFVEKFLTPDDLTIEQLKPIAAYTVWLTAQLNFNVEGLEMIEFPDRKPAKRLKREETKALESQAVDLHCKIKRALLG